VIGAEEIRLRGSVRAVQSRGKGPARAA